jgi:hypothetical protein
MRKGHRHCYKGRGRTDNQYIVTWSEENRVDIQRETELRMHYGNMKVFKVKHLQSLKINRSQWRQPRKDQMALLSTAIVCIKIKIRSRLYEARISTIHLIQWIKYKKDNSAYPVDNLSRLRTTGSRWIISIESYTIRGVSPRFTSFNANFNVKCLIVLVKLHRWISEKRKDNCKIRQLFHLFESKGSRRCLSSISIHQPWAITNPAIWLATLLGVY